MDQNGQAIGICLVYLFESVRVESLGFVLIDRSPG